MGEDLAVEVVVLEVNREEVGLDAEVLEDKTGLEPGGDNEDDDEGVLDDDKRGFVVDDGDMDRFEIVSSFLI